MRSTLITTRLDLGRGKDCLRELADVEEVRRLEMLGQLVSVSFYRGHGYRHVYPTFFWLTCVINAAGEILEFAVMTTSYLRCHKLNLRVLRVHRILLC